MVESISILEGVDRGFGLAEAFASLSEGDIARGDGVFELNGLLEGHDGFLISAGFEVNQTDVMERRGVVVKRLGDFETLDRLVVFLLFGVKNPETVVGGGVFLIKLENRKKGFFGAEGLMVAHRSLSGAPELLHLHIIASAARSLGLFFAEDGIQKGEPERE